jgi:hypothetical protein
MKQRGKRDKTAGWDRREEMGKNDKSHFQFEIHYIKWNWKNLKMTNVIKLTKLFILHFLASSKGYFSLLLDSGKVAIMVTSKKFNALRQKPNFLERGENRLFT